MKESDIKYECGRFWVGDTRNSYTVYQSGITHSTPDSSYERSEDGLSIAISRCDYLAQRVARKKEIAVLKKPTKTEAQIEAEKKELIFKLEEIRRMCNKVPKSVIEGFHGKAVSWKEHAHRALCLCDSKSPRLDRVREAYQTMRGYE